jgi:hypothetical protein
MSLTLQRLTSTRTGASTSRTCTMFAFALIHPAHKQHLAHLRSPAAVQHQLRQLRLRQLLQRLQLRRRQRHQDLLLLQGVLQSRGLALLRIQDPESSSLRRSVARRRSDWLAHTFRVLGFSVSSRNEFFHVCCLVLHFAQTEGSALRGRASQQARCVRHPEPDRAPDVRQNLRFNSVTKDFADNSRQGCCSG